jgi:hypothetical protein
MWVAMESNEKNFARSELKLMPCAETIEIGLGQEPFVFCF